MYNTLQHKGDHNHHNHNNSNSSNNGMILEKEKIETLFLLQKFDSVLDNCLRLLLINDREKQNGGNSSNSTSEDTEEGTLHYQTSKLTTEQLIQEVSTIRHICKREGKDKQAEEEENTIDGNESSSCECQWIMELLIQSLYEVGKSNTALNIISQYYMGSIPLAPFNVLALCIHLLVYIKNYRDAQDIIIQALEYRSLSTTDNNVIMKKTNTIIQNEPETLSQDQYDQLVELLIFHIMFRMNEFDEAKVFLLKNAKDLSDWKRMGFLRSLDEMIQIKEIEEANQKEQQKERERLEQEQKILKQQQQQLQHKESPLSTSTSSSSLSDQLSRNSSVNSLSDLNISNNSINNNNNNLINNNGNQINNNNHSIQNNQNQNQSTLSKVYQFSHQFFKLQIQQLRMVLVSSYSQCRSIINTLRQSYDRKKVKDAIPLIIWCTVIFFGLRYLLKNIGSNIKNRNQDNNKTMYRQPQQPKLTNPTKPPPLPSRVAPTSSSNHQYNNNNNYNNSNLRRRNLGSGSSFAQNNNNNNNRPTSRSIINSFKELFSNAFNYRI